MMWCKWSTLIFFILGTPAGAEEIRGRVESQRGLAIERARVLVVATENELFTDSNGEFTIRDCALPCLLLVTHSRFQEKTLEIREPQSQPAVAQLTAKQEIYEQIVVTASRGSEGFSPVSISSTAVSAEERTTPPTTLTELVEGVAGVAENGQGGIFQVYSIRGVSRHRVLTMIDGMPITAERRAGVSASFVDPLLMGTVDVLRGPASTYYGSGALGGVVQIFPRAWSGLNVETGWNSNGDENYQIIGWGDEDWSLGFARRSADNGETPDGTELNSHFDQISATLSRRWQSGNKTWELLAIPSVADDIGKDNTDFPGRPTNYPSETHLLLKLGLVSENGWSFHVFAHPNDLETEVLRPGNRINLVTNESFDFGGSWQREWQKDRLKGRYGIDYFGRRGVDAADRETSLVDGSISELRTLDDARQDELAAFGTITWSWGDTTLQAGTRLTWQDQQNGADPSRDDSALTGFVGLVKPLGSGLELTANIGTGLRFPNLSERFFTGTTGRGGTIGNPGLDSERSLNTDLGIRWFGTTVFLSAQVFRTDIDDYIERIELDDDTLTFRNLFSGELTGFEVEGFYRPSERWFFNWSGHLLDGDDDGGNPLADIPADRFQIGTRFREGRWQSEVRYQFRFSKDDPGSGEIAIPSANLVSAAVAYELRPDLRLRLTGKNLLGEEYRNSADDKVSLAAGRSIGLGLSWSQP